MTIEHDDLRRFKDAYLDYPEGDRDDPPALEDLPEEQRPTAEAFIESITAARGVDPYASRPSIEQLLAWQSQINDHTDEFHEALQGHLRSTVDSRASVTADAASTAAGLASASVIQARGMRIRVVPEANWADLEYAITRRAQDIVKVFSAFPDSHAVLYTTTGRECLGVVVDRSDVQRAIETPSGENRAPRLRRSITDAATACEEWLTGMIPEFEPLSFDPLEPTATPESALNPYRLASKVAREVSTSGSHARIEAKRDTWRDFGAQEAHRLAAIVREAQVGRLSEEGYKSHLDEIVGIVA